MKDNSMHAGVLAAVVTSAALAITAASAGDRAGKDASRPDDVAAMNEMVHADVNKDGLVTRDELERINPELARRFDAADADHDGKLTLSEYEALRATAVGGTSGMPASGTMRGGGLATQRR